MYKTVAIIEKSHIIQEGLSSLFKAHSICTHIANLSSIDDWNFVFKDEKPDILIINPERMRDLDLDKIRQKFDISEKLPVIGLVYQYFDMEILAMFDSTIFITDKEDIILSKIHSRHKKEHIREEKLTDREKDILRLLLKGLSNKEVAAKLRLSAHTVITHRKNIIEKTGIHSLSGLTVYAILNNITKINDI